MKEASFCGSVTGFSMFENISLLKFLLKSVYNSSEKSINVLSNYSQLYVTLNLVNYTSSKSWVVNSGSSVLSGPALFHVISPLTED